MPSLILNELVSAQHCVRTLRKEESGWRKHRELLGQRSGTKPDQGLGCVTQPIMQQGSPKGRRTLQRGHSTGAIGFLNLPLNLDLGHGGQD